MKEATVILKVNLPAGAALHSVTLRPEKGIYVTDVSYIVVELDENKVKTLTGITAACKIDSEKFAVSQNMGGK